MGLDQYVLVYRAEEAGEVQTDIPVESEFSYLHKWRKHPNLHGWMETLYRQKGGRKAEFNCATVRLDSVDLDRLEAAIKADTLPETEGFFFGVSDPECRADDLEFVSRARAAIARGFVVFYDAWW